MHAKGQDSFKTKYVLNTQNFQEKKINSLIFYHLNSPTLHCISVCVAYHAARLEHQQQENEQHPLLIQVAQYLPEWLTCTSSLDFRTRLCADHLSL